MKTDDELSIEVTKVDDDPKEVEVVDLRIEE